MGTFETASFLIAVSALVLSVWTFWLTQLRMGKLHLTRPAMFYFGWERQDGKDVPKVLFRSALFATSNRGQMLENLYLMISYEGKDYEFPYWGYDNGEGLVRGSGLYVGREGQIANHHFTPIEKYEDFKFGVGDYNIRILGKIYGSSGNRELGSYILSLRNCPAAIELADHEGGVLWDWSPVKHKYYDSGSERPDGKRQYSTWDGRA